MPTQGDRMGKGETTLPLASSKRGCASGLMLETRTATFIPEDPKISLRKVLSACMRYRSPWGLGTVKIDTNREFFSLSEVCPLPRAPDPSWDSPADLPYAFTEAASEFATCWVFRHSEQSVALPLTERRIQIFPKSAKTTTSPKMNMTLELGGALGWVAAVEDDDEDDDERDKACDSRDLLGSSLYLGSPLSVPIG